MTGLLWALFCWTLARAGHAPSRVLVPIPRHSYYTWQAVFVLPVLFVQWQCCTSVAHASARALGGRGARALLRDALAHALGWPLLGLFLLPDIFGFYARGFGFLGTLVRFTAPLAFLTSLMAATYAVRTQHGLSYTRAAAAAAAGMLAQALVGAPLLR